LAVEGKANLPTRAAVRLRTTLRLRVHRVVLQFWQSEPRGSFMKAELAMLERALKGIKKKDRAKALLAMARKVSDPKVVPLRRVAR